MTMNEFQRATLAVFAAKEAGMGASAEQMKGIAICIRNRVRQGWHDGDWLKVIENADDVRGNQPFEYGELVSTDRSLQRLVSDIDEIYFSRRDWRKEPSGDPMPSLDEAIGNAVYWAFIDRPMTKWFTDHIVADSKNHPQKTSMGIMFFYE